MMWSTGTVYWLSCKHVKLKQQLLSVECHLLSHIAKYPEYIGNCDLPHDACVIAPELRYGSSKTLQSVPLRFGHTDTLPSAITTVSHGVPMILLIYGTVLPGGANTMMSHLLIPKSAVIPNHDLMKSGNEDLAIENLSNNIKSHSWIVGSILCHMTENGLKINNLMTKTIHIIMIIKVTTSKNSVIRFLIFILKENYYR